MTHNGGKSQINFWQLKYCGQYPFINHLKASYGWETNAAAVDVDTLDSNGYPTALTAFGTYHTQCDIPTASEYTGNWILDWVGNGTLSITTNVTTVSGSLSGTNGTYTFTNNETGTGSGDNFRIGIGSLTTPITQIRLYRADHATNLANGEVWNPVFVAKLIEGNPGVLRFMDWHNTNLCNMVTWAQRRPTTYISYDGSQWSSALWAGSTAGSGNAYTVTKVGFSLVDKAQVTFRFDRSGTGLTGYTLNVQGTGAKTLCEMGLAGPFNNFFTQGTQILQIGTATYDLNLDTWLLSGGAGNQFDVGILNGVPPELCVSLCNLVGAHPWFCIPVYALDPISDYTAGLAAYCRDNLASGLIPRFEPVNEIWNTRFKPTGYAASKSSALWGVGTGDYDNWYGKAASLMGQAISAVYSADRSRYQVIFGVWTAANGGTSDGGFSTARYSSALYVSVNGGSPASSWVTDVAITDYWWSTYTDAEYAQAQIDYDAGTAPQRLVIVAAYVNSAYGTTGPHLTEGIPYLKTQFTSWAAACVSRGIRLTCYEGGWALDSSVALHIASFASPLLYDQYLDVYNTFVSSGGLFPSQFIMAGNGGDCILNPDIYAPSSAWTAIIAFNRRVTAVPRLRLRLHG